MKAHKTTITLVVYSTDPIPDELGADLTDIVWSISEGENIGDWTVTSHEEVEDEELRKQLIAIGNDGTFFDYGDDGDDDSFDPHDPRPTDPGEVGYVEPK